jgi:hypothetical protein
LAVPRETFSNKTNEAFTRLLQILTFATPLKLFSLSLSLDRNKKSKQRERKTTKRKEMRKIKTKGKKTGWVLPG